MSNLRQAIGQALKARRNQQGLSLRALSAKAKVSLGFLSEIERGQKEASSELLKAITIALEIPLSQVVLQAANVLAKAEQAEQSVVVKLPVKNQERAA